MYTIRDPRELAIVLAALRFWQRKAWDDIPERIIATDDGAFEALTDVEIDDLCLRINLGGAPQYYLMHVEGCVAPELIGPFTTDEERDEEARKVRAEQRYNDALFWLDLRSGVPAVGAYSAWFLDPDFDDEEY